MSPLGILWSLLSIVPGAGFLVASGSLWDARKQPGSLFPLIFCLANGLYDVFFGVIILVAANRPVGADNIDLAVLWVVLYIPARVSSIGLGLLLSGQIGEAWLRNALGLSGPDLIDLLEYEKELLYQREHNIDLRPPPSIPGSDWNDGEILAMTDNRAAALALYNKIRSSA